MATEKLYINKMAYTAKDPCPIAFSVPNRNTS